MARYAGLEKTGNWRIVQELTPEHEAYIIAGDLEEKDFTFLLIVLAVIALVLLIFVVKLHLKVQSLTKNPPRRSTQITDESIEVGTVKGEDDAKAKSRNE